MIEQKTTNEQALVFEKLKKIVELVSDKKVGGRFDESPEHYIKELHQIIHVLQQNNGLDYYRTIQGSGPQRFIKRMIRKMGAWIGVPIVQQQSFVNGNISQCLLDMTILHQNNCAKIEHVLDESTKANQSALSASATLEQTTERMEQTLRQEADKRIKLESSLKKLQIAMLHMEQRSIAGKIPADYSEGEREERDSFIKQYYAQAGEDAIIDYILRMFCIPYEDVTYLDLGANHARELSNTYFLYRHGASGVLVEANPELVPELDALRPRDSILNKGIDMKSDQEITFYVMSGDGLSTTDRESAEEFCRKNPDLRIEKEIRVETITVQDIIRNHFNGEAPTVLSIDIEGKEQEILESIDYVSCRPLVIISEMIDYLSIDKNTHIKDYLESKGYMEYAFTGINSIFLDRAYAERKRENRE